MRQRTHTIVFLLSVGVLMLCAFPLMDAALPGYATATPSSLWDWLRAMLALIVCILSGIELLPREQTTASAPVIPGPVSLETPRLAIRYFRLEDWRDLHEYLSEPEVVRYEPYEVYNEDMSRLEAKSRATDHDFLAVCLRDGGKMIGNLYFAARDFGTMELGYVFNPRYQKQGYATEAVTALIDTAFRRWRVRRIIAMCDPRNENSWRLLERVGFRREGHFLQKGSFKTDSTGKPIWHDAYEYGLLASEWPANSEAGNDTKASG